MACFRPLKNCWRSSTVNPATGKRSITWNFKEAFHDMPMVLKCGQCVGCRLDRSAQWAIRCMHEASLYEKNCFITLTYNDASLPAGGSLVLDDYQKFMKRLRFRFGNGIRFFHAGEYGEKYQRPHYHAILFNFDFPDKEPWKVRNGHQTWRSSALEELWPFGFSEIGTATFESAAYVARYLLKKKTGAQAVDAYTTFDRNTGEIYSERKPEYTTMSRKPGLGKGWFDQFKGDAYPSDFVVFAGKKFRPPKYYDSLYELEYPSDFRNLKFTRVRNAKAHGDNNSDSRLAVREKVQKLRLTQLKRGYENGTENL